MGNLWLIVSRGAHSSTHKLPQAVCIQVAVSLLTAAIYLVSIELCFKVSQVRQWILVKDSRARLCGWSENPSRKRRIYKLYHQINICQNGQEFWRIVELQMKWRLDDEQDFCLGSYTWVSVKTTCSCPLQKITTCVPALHPQSQTTVQW